MKRQGSLALLSSALLFTLATLTAACGMTVDAPLTSGAGGAGTGSSSISAGAGGSGETATGTTTTGGACKLIDDACEAPSDCCSGECIDQRCAGCAVPGASCAVGCCDGLVCYHDVCGACALDDNVCTLDSDCCSNLCNDGRCDHCGGAGEPCGDGNGACCDGTQCVEGACCAAAGAACEDASSCCGGSACVAGTCAI